MQSQSSVNTSVLEFMNNVQAMFVDGTWLHGSDPLAIIDPSSEEVLTHVGQASESDANAAVEAARVVLTRAEWANLPPSERARLLFRLADLLERDAGIIAELETLNSGIPISLTRYMALPLSASLLRYYAGWVTKMCGEVIPAAPGAAMGSPTLTYTRREPAGVVAQIVPWNFPLGLAMLKIAPALAAGCTVVLKPSEFTPISVLYLAKLTVEAGFPPGVFNVVNGGPPAAAALVSHPDVSRVAFTGSSQVGQTILRAAAGSLKKVSLELGGKSPVIVFDDADLELAIPGAAMAAFLLTGQNCMAGTRLFVHRKVHDRVVAGIEKIAKALVVGAAIHPETALGPLISRRHRDRVLGYVEAGVEEGAELVTGGSTVGETGFFVQPTVFANTNPSMRIVREEIFGPVISIQQFEDEDLEELGRKVNDTPYGLSASVWTTNLSRAHRMAHLVQAGQVSINCHGAVDAGIPFGGYKQSGWGRDYGPEALDLYTETKAITVRL